MRGFIGVVSKHHVGNVFWFDSPFEVQRSSCFLTDR